MSKQPPFSITNKIVGQVAEIAELTGKVSVVSGFSKNPTLRRKNRIRTIYGSLSIENNTLTAEQVTAVINGKTVLAPPKDIEEVKNAYEIYEHLEQLDPFSVDDLLKAHGVMMRGLTENCGEFRERPVGVANSRTGEIIHFGTLPQYVPALTEQLLQWTYCQTMAYADAFKMEQFICLAVCRINDLSETAGVLSCNSVLQ